MRENDLWDEILINQQNINKYRDLTFEKAIAQIEKEKEP